MYIAIIAATVAAAVLLTVVPTFYYKYMRLYKAAPVGGGQGLVLSFDDGPDPEYTPLLLDLLQKEQVRATFFVTAENAAAHPELLARMRDEGHIVGFHSLRHDNMMLLSPRATKRQFEEGLRVVDTEWFRPPYGFVNLFTLHYARKYGQKIVLWNVIPRDWRRDVSSEELLHRLRASARDGAVILLHDGCGGAAADRTAPRRTLTALAVLLPELKNAGYRFLTVADCDTRPLCAGFTNKYNVTG